MAEGLEIERRGPTLVASVNRGERNSFSGAMIDSLADAVEDAARDDSCRFVRLRARGNVFCLGRDAEGTTPTELRAAAARIVRLTEALRAAPLVVVAEVNGDAAGFGCGVIAAADIAVASTSARFRFPELGMGLAPAIVISWASKTFPTKRAFDMVVTSEPIDAASALDVGLITEVVPPARVAARVDERLAAMETLDAAAVRDVKRLFVDVRTMDAASAARSAVDALALASLRLQG